MTRLAAAGRWLARRAGRRGAFLAFLVVLDLAYGTALLTTSVAALQHSPDLFLPLHAWGWIWAGAGAAIATGVLARRDWPQYTIATALKTCWAFVYVTLWIRGTAQAWVSVVVWLAFAATVIIIAGWPEKTLP